MRASKRLAPLVGANPETREATLYRYLGSGLASVYLRNGYEERRTFSGRDVVWIDDIAGLHRALVVHISGLGRTLSPKEFKFLRKERQLALEADGNSEIVAAHQVASELQPDRAFAFERQENRWNIVT